MIGKESSGLSDDAAHDAPGLPSQTVPSKPEKRSSDTGATKAQSATRASRKRTMTQEKTSTVGSLFRELFQLGVYKRSQGKLVRQTTFGALAATCALGCWSLSNQLIGTQPAVRYTVPAVILAVGLWLSFRLVNLPQFADFLIAVEAELSKVTWPTRSAMFRSAAVVIITMFFLAFLLFAYDTIWKKLLDILGVTG